MFAANVTSAALPDRPSAFVPLRLLVCRLSALALALLICAAAPVEAAAHIRVETQEIQTTNGKPAAALVVNGSVVARLAKDEGGNPPLRRVSAAATLLTTAYRSGKFDLKTQASDKTGRRWVLFVNGVALLIASDQEAKAWGVEPKALAETWQDNIAAAVKLEKAAAPAQPPAATPPVVPPAAASPGPAPSIALSAGSTGKGSAVTTSATTQYVYEPPTATQLDNAIKLPAGAVVTGSSAGPDILAASISSALRSQLKLGADDPLTWRQSGTDPAPTVGPGQTRSLGVDYTAGGSASSTTLGLQNLALKLPRENITLFSNDPESVYAPQLLYSATLPAGQAARLVYHHQCQVEGGVRFIVRVLSESDPGALHVVPGTAAPDVNTFYIGFKSAENFWNNLNNGNGYVAQVPSGGQAVLLGQQLARGYTASGYMKLTNLGAQPLRLEVLALSTGTGLPHGAAPQTAKTATCVFDAPYFSEDNQFKSGDPWLYLRLGEARPASATDESVLHGCYGMTHSFNVTLSNPGATPTVVYIVLRASAGEVKGQFFINGEYVSTPLVTSGEEQVLKEIGLAPGENKQLRIKALALNGGFYPASVIVRETRYP